ncbi:MAG: TetR/AcrR family transcriptional regulator [Burkholderiaceae bacterium]|nr:TetR/AcrR family transcriptional regulator [Burkholderiaceae bacterium]
MSMNEPLESMRFRRRKDARPGEISRAALEVFCRKGFVATRIEDVAALSQVSTGTIFVYFRNKEMLFRSVVNEGLAVFAAAMKDIAVGEGSPVEQLREYLEAWNQLLADKSRSSLLRLVAIEGARFPDIVESVFQTIEPRARQAVIDILRKGIASGDFHPFKPEVVADIVLSPFSLCALEDTWKRNPTPHALLKVSLDILCRGLSEGERGQR